ncbi:putative T7SS-secreted protein [Streptomyces sp. NPDC002889]|uniref:putative T7SS-secreted protein n=1 Tax=Streptomyces sp. NPDC002889 TaxID=3364669 RepID=UPI0036B3CFC0
MPEYPHLGWDPVPGSPSAIDALQKKLTTSATALGTAHQLVEQLLGESTHWHGEAATAFRNSLDGDLPRYLKNAHRSISKAAAQLRTWHDDLVSYQATARRYDSRAQLDAAALSRAESHHESVRGTPDLPPSELSAAADAVTKARDALASVRTQARELEETHRAEASRIAQALNEATDKLAPREPGALDKFLKWIDEDLGDALSDVSAIAGFLAVAIGPFFPPAGLVLMLVATGASIGALTLHLADSKMRTSLKDGFTKGEFDADFWDSAVTLTGDTLGSVPGVAAIAHGAKSASAAAHVAGAVADPGSIAALRAGSQGFASGAWNATDELRQVENPLTEWALQSTPRYVREGVTCTFAGAGAGAAITHYPPFDDDESLAHTATGVDGTRAVLDDGPSAAAKAAHAWASLAR